MGIPLIALMGNSSTHPVQPDNMLEDAALAQRIGASRQQQAQQAALAPGQLAQQNLQTQLGQQAVDSGLSTSRRGKLSMTHGNKPLRAHRTERFNLIPTNFRARSHFRATVLQFLQSPKV